MDMNAIIGRLASDGAGHTLPQTADPGELAQHIKSQLLSGDKVLNKNQRKKARKKVTKLLHKTLGVPRPASDTSRGAADVPPTASEDTGCSNRRTPGVRADPPACTSSPQSGPRRAAKAPQPPPSSLPAVGALAPGALGGGSGSGGAKAGAVEAAGGRPHQEPPPPKRRRLQSDTGPPPSGNAQVPRYQGPADGGSQPLPPSGSRGGGGGCHRKQPKARAVPSPNRQGSGAPRAGAASRSADGVSVGMGLSGGNSSQLQVSRGEQKRLSRRQALPEDLLTADNDGDGDDGTGGGGSLYGSGLYGSVGGAQGGAGGGKARKGGEGGQEGGGAAGRGRRRDRRERNPRQQRQGKRPRDGGDGGGGGDGDGRGGTAPDTSIAAAASEEIVQVVRPTGTAASAAAAAMAVAVHRSAPYLLHRGVFAATLVGAAAGPPRPILAMAARSAACTTAGQGQVDLSAALLLMRVQARAAEGVPLGASVEPSCTALTGTEGDGAPGGAAAGASAREGATGSGTTGAIAGSAGADAVQPTRDPNQAIARPTAVTEAAAASGAVAVRMGASGGAADGEAGASGSPGAWRRRQQQQQQRPGGSGGTGPVAGVGPGSQKRAAVAAGQQPAPAARATLYRYGNYHRYYGYRLGQDLDEDPRVKLMRREWFQNRVCFDIGCNEGLVTLAVAARFGAKRMTGYDIDASLIKRACRNLRIMRSEYTSRLQALTLGGPTPGSAAPRWGDGGGWDSPQMQEQQHPDPQGQRERLGGDEGEGEGEGEFDRGENVVVEEEEEEGREEEMMVVEEEEEEEEGCEEEGRAGAEAGTAGAGAEGGGGGGDGGPEGADGGGGADGDDYAAEAGAAAAADGAARGSSQQPGTRPRSQPPPRVPYLTAKPPPPRVGVLRSYVRSLAGTHFVQQDWANARGRPESADTILCLSVTKWVHLNNGDEGLKRMFKKFFDTLTPGGLLVLEPQPWKSYKRAVSKTTTNAVPFKRIEQLQLRPQHFLDYLTSSQVGFLLEARLNEGGAAGFDRPMFLLRKPAPGSAEGGAAGTMAAAQ